ncbi:MAG: hypothetical protein ABJK59_13585 [Erythrobacter sp.]|uniref:hypothetical protein n=1 Tax=Erythrobacter sp. TaxID=1042 RepID=UPI00329924BA
MTDQTDPKSAWIYKKEVENFGGDQPKFDFRNKNETDVSWSDVKTDGQGNVIQMPLLKSKQCFGRIEYRMRHEKADAEKMLLRGKMVPSETRCDRCRVKTKMTEESCGLLIRERIKSDPGILGALKNWRRAVDKAMADPIEKKVYSPRSSLFSRDQFGHLWQDVLDAIARRGRFANSNDEAVLVQIEEAKRRERKKRADKMRAKREAERRELRARQQPPPRKFVKAAWDECLKRRDQLMAARGAAGIGRQISRIADQACELTAYAWYYSELLGFRSLPIKPGSMAKWLVENELAPGQSYENLKVRLKRDIERAREIEEGVYGHIWQPFDPDADLEF